MLATARARTKQGKRRDDHKGHRAGFRSISVIALRFFNFKHALVVRVLCSCQFQSSSRFVFICVRSVKFFQCALAIAIRFVRDMLYACCARVRADRKKSEIFTDD